MGLRMLLVLVVRLSWPLLRWLRVSTRAELGVEAVADCTRMGWEPGSLIWRWYGVLGDDGFLYLLFQHDHHVLAETGMEGIVDSHQQRQELVVERVEEGRNLTLQICSTLGEVARLQVWYGLVDGGNNATQE
ncbi:hypothetical protein VPNG_07595 [Cytospora leucostoma]|uniref:Secreted protein n=1 Tax=Cytospora leucostoma TaxID=1230097 RepID=A0A423WDB3_9PEZI|nr:hypothetical protein VPNG_07595 [Cytospora leucostoma]